MSKLFEILYTLNQDEKSSQRNLAAACNVSIGKVNSLIKEAQANGFLLIEKRNTKTTYQLTDKGTKLIAEYLTDQNNLKIKIQNEKISPVTTAVILAAGKRTDFDVPIAFLKINEESSFIERTVRILLEQNIDNIIIVTGYKSDMFQALVEKFPKIKLVHNNNYQNTGTMQSLATADKYLKTDFLLLESDIIFEAKAIKELIDYPERDCMIITNESGSGDEALVEIRDNYIYNMTKDRHQLNKIDGEMIGITKVSYGMFKKMMDRFQDNKNPYLNYEYMLMDIGRKYKIGFKKMGNLLWWEVDTKKHYDKFRVSILRQLSFREREWRFDEVKKVVSEALKTPPELITAIDYVGGMTNTSYKVTIEGKNYIARIPGAGTEDMISRVNEKRSCQVASLLELDAQVIYIDDQSGVKIAEFIENAETLTFAMSKRADVMTEVTNLLKRLHHSDMKFENDFDVFREIEKYEILVNAAQGYLFDDYLETKTRVVRLKALLVKLGVTRVACHNDTGAFNILRDQTGRFYLIDWEYAGNNDPVWDLAAHALESEFNKTEELMLLQKYFETDDVSENDKMKLLIFQICQDFLWSVWTCIKEAKGNDFGSYGIDRYERAKLKLDELDSWLEK